MTECYFQMMWHSFDSILWSDEFGWYFKETARSMLRDQFSLLNFPLDPVCGGVPTPGGHLSTEPLSATANSKPTRVGACTAVWLQVGHHASASGVLW